MLPDSALSLIESYKAHYLCQAYLEGNQIQLSNLFHVYIKDLYIDETEIELTVGFTPKENTLFVSRYLDHRRFLPNIIPNIHEKTILQIETFKNKDPLTINKYNLYKHLSPTNHKANLSTTIEGININCKLVMDDRFLIQTNPYTLELNPTFSQTQAYIGATYAFPG